MKKIKKKIKKKKIGSKIELSRLHLPEVKFQEAEYLYGRGLELQEKGQLKEAVVCYQNAISMNPSFPAAYYSLGTLLKEKGEFDEAIKCYQKVLQINPNHADTYNCLGAIFQEMQKYDEAIDYYEKAIELKPYFTKAFINLANTFTEKEQFDEAIQYYQKAIVIDPNFAGAYYNLGLLFHRTKQFNEAITFYKKTIQLDPNFADAYYGLSLLYLLLGNFEEGWKLFEWRWKLKDAYQPNFKQPLWDGGSLAGKKLFVYTEQGIGDEVMFASCLPQVIKEADSCIVVCDRRLVPLFSRSFPEVEVIERIVKGDGYPEDVLAADIRIAIGSLPRYFRPDLSSFPRQKSYLIADSQNVEEWRKRFQTLGEGLKIGISWRGGKDPAIQRSRSTVLQQWAGILSLRGVQFINLQYGDCRADLGEAREKMGITIHDWEDADPLKDLDNFAAQISALDLVISIDNSTVHMAGALGVSVWTLLPFICDWRWMLKYEDTPWYQSVRLFRQPSPGDWESVILKVRNELLNFLDKN